MKKSVVSLFTGIVVLATIQSINAQTIATWTFETSQPGVVSLPAAPGAGVAFTNLTPEVGAGTGTALHVGAATYSSPAGNGSARSFSVNTWAVGDYFQFSVSTVGFTGISLSFDQDGSTTGPSTFQLAYSTDGTTYNNFGSTYVIPSGVVWTAGSANPAGNTSFAYDLSAVTALNNAPNVFFRIIDSSTTSIAGGTVGTGGTDRVDNFSVFVTPVPEPSTIALAVISGVAGLVAFRRRR